MMTLPRTKLAILACTCLMPPAIAAAQAPSAPQRVATAAQTTQLQEVVVTATRKEENLQKVAVAVTALTGANLASQQITEATDLQRAVPNILVTNYGGRPNESRIGLRGPFNLDAQISLDNPVGLYLDGVYISRNAGANLDFLDVSRVEVLRGPQGTLFGRNTIGGAVSVITNQPNQQLGGWLEAGYGDYNAWKLSGVANLPVNDSTAVRIAYEHSQRDGYWHSTLTGQDIGNDNENFGRISLKHDFGAHWHLFLSADGTIDENNGANQALTAMLPIFGGFDYVQLSSGFQKSGADYIHPYTYDHTTPYQHILAKSLGLNATITGDLGPATFRSITGYRTGNETDTVDSVDCAACGGVYDKGYRGSSEFSEEGQLLGKAFDNRLDWIVGAYYFTETGNEYDRYVILWPAFLQTFAATNGTGKNNSVGVFAQATYKITDMISLTGGVRYTHDERSIVDKNFLWNAGFGPDPTWNSPSIGCQLAGAVLANDCATPTPVASFNYLPWTVGANLTPVKDILLYAKYSKGYRAGGYNLRGASLTAINSFNPEGLGSWEVGEKAELFGHHLRLNADVYYDDYTQIQLSKIVLAEGSGQPTSVVANAGNARIWGVEAEATVVLGNFTVNGSIGSANAKYTFLDPATGLTTAQPFPYTPKLTAYIGGDYKLPTSFGDIDLHVDEAYRGSTFFGSTVASITQPAATIPGYWLLNGVATARFTRQGVDLSVWAKNITDTNYQTFVDDITSAGYINGQIGDPRTFGFTVTKHF